MWHKKFPSREEVTGLLDQCDDNTRIVTSATLGISAVRLSHVQGSGYRESILIAKKSFVMTYRGWLVFISEPWDDPVIFSVNAPLDSGFTTPDIVEIG